MSIETTTRTTFIIHDLDGHAHYVQQDELMSVACDCIREHFAKGSTVTNPATASLQLQLLLGAYEHEVFSALWLDNRHRIIRHSELFRGTIDAASVYPREVVKDALSCNAAAVIFAHNHPSGIAEPSQADVKITERLVKALELIDVRVLDHFVIGETVVSMAERGLL
ncbi:RadC family protein [Marinobacterium sedimentorum]|uniref:RadC family protein n=1 Tax=Marinobacterium sedimentorum TaxID=2927804 RepID=UPI0020C6039E|nr:DNA repair protein RadC [Marinobacterium sedimentorum]MCP8685952.1 DNA repair protein RadC [Marinobacterium sedimentorum]